MGQAASSIRVQILASPLCCAVALGNFSKALLSSVENGKNNADTAEVLGQLDRERWNVW